MVGGNRFKRRKAFGAIMVQEALSVLNRFDWLAWRVGVETFMESCSTRWRLDAAEYSVDIVGIAALSWMRLTVVLLNSLSMLL